MMKTKLILSTLFGMAAWSLSSAVAANWDTGACPQPHQGPAPCIETEINGNTYHFNGSGGHADVWHGRPAAEGGGAFDFTGNNVDLDCPDGNPSCTLTLSGEVKKCQDSDDNWRLGVRVVSADVAPGDFLCNFIGVSGFPWYAKDPSATPQCPFEDDCDTFIPYDANASTYTANFGTITVTTPFGTAVNGEYVPGVVFTPGVGANFNFSGPIQFMECDGSDGDCTIDGILTLDNGTSLNVY